ncbi:MAG: hypothetical protein KGJ90_00440 [Patescibacteria group bacterium]|nr:hypothetical protein [Patescibacteria group bacterium]
MSSVLYIFFFETQGGLPVCPTPDPAYGSAPQRLQPGQLTFDGAPLPDLAASTQLVTPLFDFSSVLPEGVTLISDPKVLCYDLTNTDPTPQGRIISQAGIFGLGVNSNCVVAAQIGRGVAGADYLLVFSAMASNTDVWVGWTHMQCVTPK